MTSDQLQQHQMSDKDANGVHLPPMPMTPTEQNRRDMEKNQMQKMGSNQIIHLNRGSSDASNKYKQAQMDQVAS